MNIRPYYQSPFLAKISKQLAIAYIVSGAVTTIADYSTFTLLFSVIPTGLFTATAVAFLVGLVVSYLQNRFWVFKRGASLQAESTNIWRYITFLAFNLLVTYIMLWFMEAYFGITPYVGKIVVGIFMFFWIYIGNNYWVFRGPRTGPIKL